MNYLNKRKKNSGFTIIEILIAIVILTVGILGILAIFPKAIESASKSIEDTYTGVIAQSVMDGIKSGIRETKVTLVDPSSPTPTKYFLLQHEGVGFWSNTKSDITKLDLTLPKDVMTYKGTMILPLGRDKPVIYPRKLNDNDFKGAFNADDSGKILDTTVDDIFAFGDGPAGKGVSALQDRLDDPNTSPLEKRLVTKDPYLSYGFALVVNRSVLNNGKRTDDLYLFSVWIFRNWVKSQKHKAGKPIHQLSSLVAF